MTTLTINQIKNEAYKLIENQQFAILTSIDANGFPHSRVMFNLHDQNNFKEIQQAFNGSKHQFLLYFSTNTSSQKMSHFKLNRNVSVLISNNSEFLGVSLNGEIEIVHDMKVKHDLWFHGSEKYYSKGIEDPDYSVLKLVPNELEWWGFFQKAKIKLN